MQLWTTRFRNLAFKKWFAWHPVWVFEGNRRHLVWLQFIERRWNLHEGVDVSPDWEYALRPKRDRKENQHVHPKG